MILTLQLSYMPRALGLSPGWLTTIPHLRIWESIPTTLLWYMRTKDWDQNYGCCRKFSHPMIRKVRKSWNWSLNRESVIPHHHEEIPILNKLQSWRNWWRNPTILSGKWRSKLKIWLRNCGNLNGNAKICNPNWKLHSFRNKRLLARWTPLPLSINRKLRFLTTEFIAWNKKSGS